MRPLRVVASCWRFELSMLIRSALFVISGLIQPVLFASIAFYLDGAGGGHALLYTAVGAGLMGMWSSTLFGSGMAMQAQRRQGVLELLILAPQRYVAILSGLTLATASLGIYSMAATLVWGRLAFGVPLALAHPFLFVLALVMAVVSLGELGVVMASSFVLWRGANALANLLEYPIWLVSGLLVPLTLLPGWVTPLSWLLATNWSAEAVRRAALGGSPLAAIGMCAVLTVAYLVLGTVVLRYLERRARAQASFALA